ncbi:MAG: RNA polymerase sigma factor [Eubacterium sp.]|nr:RNA polymerase sigma factor [Eubacterium sp.]
MISIYLSMLDTDEEKDKFETIYTTYRSVLYYHAYKILKDNFLAEDAVHDTFLYLIKRMDKIDDPYSKETRNFLILIAKNKALKIYNKNKNEVADDEFLEKSPDLSRLEEKVENKVFQQHVMNIINSLDDKYSSVIMLKYHLGMKDKDIADMIGVSLSNERIRVKRARDMIKQKLLEENENDR